MRSTRHREGTKRVEQRPQALGPVNASTLSFFMLFLEQPRLSSSASGPQSSLPVLEVWLLCFFFFQGSLRKPHGAGPAHGTMVRLQYSFTQGQCANKALDFRLLSRSLGDPGLGQSCSLSRNTALRSSGFAHLPPKARLVDVNKMFRRMNSFQGGEVISQAI